MWNCQSEDILPGKGRQFLLRRDNVPLTYAEVIQLWQGDDGFRAFFTQVLAAVPYHAFRWETPPITDRTASHPFRFVLLDDPLLDTEPEPHAFAGYFLDRAADTTVLAFPNLGHDAIMVVPRQLGPAAAYAHLGIFLRHAPRTQVHALWREVGLSVAQRLGRTPLWVSTAGGGVAWLHVRLDDQPKYYRHAPYRNGG